MGDGRGDMGKTQDVTVAGGRVFLSGPMTGYEDYNAMGFVKAQILVKRLGAAFVYNPIMQWICEPEDVSRGRGHESYMLECLHELTRMGEDGAPFYSAVVQLDGWEASEGARAEAAVAETCGIMRVSLSSLVADNQDGDGDGDDDQGEDENGCGICVPDVPAERPVHDATPSHAEPLRPEWESVSVSWQDVAEDGTARERPDRSSRNRNDAAMMVVIQGILEDRGIALGEVAKMTIFDAATVGMNAFVSQVGCDVTMRDGSRSHLSFELAGPVIPDSGKPLSEQVEADRVSWR